MASVKQTTDEDKYYLVYYSQNREDLIISALFSGQKGGFYIDVGSNHPINHSVTKLLYRNGWSGVNIDPNSSLVQLTRFDRKRDIHINAGLGSKSGKEVFRIYSNAGLSTFSEDLMASYSKVSSVFTDMYCDEEVDILTLAEVCRKNDITKIDLLKIDVEGYEKEVLVGNNWDKYRPKVICIENNHKREDWSEYIIQQGYIRIFNDGLNDYFTEEKSGIAEKISAYPEEILKYPHVVDHDVMNYLRLLRLRKSVNYYADLPPSRYTPDINSFKNNVRNSFHELKYLAKQKYSQTYQYTSDSKSVDGAKSNKDSVSYLKKVNQVYAYSMIRRQRMLSAKPVGLHHRMKLVFIDTPAIILPEAVKSIRRRSRK